MNGLSTINMSPNQEKKLKKRKHSSRMRIDRAVTRNEQ